MSSRAFLTQPIKLAGLDVMAIGTQYEKHLFLFAVSVVKVKSSHVLKPAALTLVADFSHVE
jgi:hypothetical protein